MTSKNFRSQALRQRKNTNAATQPRQGLRAVTLASHRPHTPAAAKETLGHEQLLLRQQPGAQPSSALSLPPTVPPRFLVSREHQQQGELSFLYSPNPTVYLPSTHPTCLAPRLPRPHARARCGAALSPPPKWCSSRAAPTGGPLHPSAVAAVRLAGEFGIWRETLAPCQNSGWRGSDQGSPGAPRAGESVLNCALLPCPSLLRVWELFFFRSRIRLNFVLGNGASSFCW